MARNNGVTLLSFWPFIVVVTLPILAPSLFSASSWKTSIFSLSSMEILADPVDALPYAEQSSISGNSTMNLSCRLHNRSPCDYLMNLETWQGQEVFQKVLDFGRGNFQSPRTSIGLAVINCALCDILQEWEPPTARHSALLDSLVKTRLTETEPENLWNLPDSGGWEPCPTQSDESLLPAGSNGYLQVFLEGGLNQQRMGICDAVAVAKILNATLLLPQFDVNPVWKDASSFADIFDVEHFLHTLKLDIKLVMELPQEYKWSTREYYATGYRTTRVKNAPVQASSEWYITNVLPLMRSSGVVAIAPFSHRLSFSKLPDDIQRLRCKVNFQALRFVASISRLGSTLIERLRKTQSLITDDTGRDSKYLALHLRFDKDMAAHSACDFGGGKAERLALAKYRSVVWQGRVSNALLSDKELRDQGKCPMTPEEVGLMLAALGFGPHTHVYLASYMVYGGSARVEFLRTLFPGMVTKYSLATSEELQPFEGKASQLAALDYHVSLHSDIFISASRGNMHNSLAAHRTYLKVRKTIKPDMNLMARLFADKSLAWSDFRNRVIAGHTSRMGQVSLRQPNQSIYTYPAPDCMCRRHFLKE